MSTCSSTDSAGSMSTWPRSPSCNPCRTLSCTCSSPWQLKVTLLGSAAAPPVLRRRRPLLRRSPFRCRPAAPAERARSARLAGACCPRALAIARAGRARDVAAAAASATAGRGGSAERTEVETPSATKANESRRFVMVSRLFHGWGRTRHELLTSRKPPTNECDDRLPRAPRAFLSRRRARRCALARGTNAPAHSEQRRTSTPPIGSSCFASANGRARWASRGPCRRTPGNRETATTAETRLGSGVPQSTRAASASMVDAVSHLAGSNQSIPSQALGQRITHLELRARRDSHAASAPGARGAAGDRKSIRVARRRAGRHREMHARSGITAG